MYRVWKRVLCIDQWCGKDKVYIITPSPCVCIGASPRMAYFYVSVYVSVRIVFSCGEVGPGGINGVNGLDMFNWICI